MVPHLSPLELAALRWRSFDACAAARRMYLSHLAEGLQLNDCGAASRFTDKVKAVAHGLYKQRDSSSSTRPATKRPRPRQLTRSFSFQDAPTLLAAISRIFFLRVSSEGIPIRKARLTLGM